MGRGACRALISQGSGESLRLPLPGCRQAAVPRMCSAVSRVRFPFSSSRYIVLFTSGALGASVALWDATVSRLQTKVGAFSWKI